MSDGPVHFQSLATLSRAIQSGQLSPVDLIDATLERIDRLAPTLNAFVELCPERARAQAHAAKLELDAGINRGPLHGLPYVAKDLFDVAGFATRAGTQLLSGNIAERDSTVVAKLAAAGMVLVGKTHTVQFAFGGVGSNRDYGTPHNPWHAEPHAPGGSSSGTGVAVASGMAPMGLGSDTGGSVRIPAALCGISGLKTTVGRVSRAGVYPLSWTLDSVGPLARTVEDLAFAYTAIQGPDPADETTAGQAPHDVLSSLQAGVSGLRLRFAETTYWDDVDPAVAAAVRATGDVFANLGADVGSIPFREAGDIMTGRGEKHRAMIIAAEACAQNYRLLDEHFDQLDPNVANRMITGRDLTAPDYFETVQTWRALQQSAVRTLHDVDALIVPTCAVTAAPMGEILADSDSYVKWNGAYLRNTALGNMLNLCGVSVPCGFDANGLPIGVSILAKPFDEGAALRVAHAFQEATDWHRNPDLSWADS